MSLGYRCIGAGNADGGDACCRKGICCCDGNTGAVGAERDERMLVDDVGSCGNRLLVDRAVIGDVQLNGVLLACDSYLVVEAVSVLSADDLLLTACGIIARGRLKYADNDLLALGIELDTVGGVGGGSALSCVV